MKAMILAAGLGTRLKPFTDEHPKALAVVNGKTLLQRNIEYLSTFGIKDIIVNVHHFPDQIKKELTDHNGFGSAITISDETDAVLETGGGLKKAASFLHGDEPFVLLNVDILTDCNLSEMIAYHIKNQALATLAVTSRTTSRYFLFDINRQLCGWRNTATGAEKISRPAKDYLPMAFSGIHILSPAIFSFLNMEGKFSMVDVYLDLAEDQKIIAYDHSGGKLLDVGKPESLQQAELMFP